MSTLGLLILVALGANLALGLLVLVTHPRRNVNQSYMLVAFFVTIWQFFVWRAYDAVDAEAAAHAIRMASAFAAVFPVASHLLRLAILHPGEHLGRLAWRIRVLLAVGMAVSALCLSPWMLRDVIMPAPTEPEWHVAEPVYGAGYTVFIVYFILAGISLLVGLLRARRTTRGIARVEIGFILLGVAVALMVGSFGSMIVPWLTGSSQSVPLSNSVSILILTSIVSYGIATRRIMDMAALMRRTVAYILLVLLLAALYMGVFGAVDFVARRVLVGAGFLPHLSAMLTVVLVMLPAKGRMNQIARRLFVDASTVDVPAVMDEATSLCESVTRLDELLALFSRLVARAWQVETMSILLGDETGVFVPEHRTSGVAADICLAPDDPVLALLLQQREPVQIDALRRRRPTATERSATERLQELGAELAVGIVRRKRVVGVMLLGARRDGRLYDRIAQDALGQLGRQLAVAIENARLYTQVQDAKNYHEVLVDSLVNGVLAVNVEGRITVCNREALRLLGFPPAFVAERSMKILPEALRIPLQDALRREKETRDAEITVVRPDDGEAVPLRLGSSYIRGHEGGVIGALLVFQDLTAIRRLEAQLRRSDRLASLGTLAAGMAHEIKNPLVTIKTFAQLLPEQFDDPDFRGRFSPLVQKEVNRIDTLVTGLLEFARPIRPKMTPVHLHGILEHTMQLCEQAMGTRGVRLVKMLEASDDRILGDANLLVQVFLNLALNAIEAMGDGGTLSVRTLTAGPTPGHPAEGGVHVQVMDTGRGIRREDLPRIFDPFFTTREEGTGLGLAIAHGILQQHSAMIDLDSTPGVGTVFTLTFPRTREAVR